MKAHKSLKTKKAMQIKQFKNVFIAIIAIVLLLPVSNVQACSCLAESDYITQSIPSSTYIAKIKITELSDKSSVKQEDYAFSEQEIKFETLEEYFKTNSQSTNTFKQKIITEHQARSCTPQCESYLGSRIGGERELKINEIYLIILINKDSRNALFASLPLDSKDDLSEDFLQFSKGENVSKVISYLEENSESIKKYRSTPLINTTILLIGIAVITLVMIAIGVIIYSRIKKTTK